ncbi:hypothetical protein PFISCL1PPCAC_15927, partial [Pristionchus fissidentatus]
LEKLFVFSLLFVASFAQEGSEGAKTVNKRQVFYTTGYSGYPGVFGGFPYGFGGYPYSYGYGFPSFGFSPIQTVTVTIPPPVVVPPATVVGNVPAVKVVPVSSYPTPPPPPHPLPEPEPHPHPHPHPHSHNHGSVTKISVIQKRETE